ncbi:hypothetical protein HPGCJGGD_3045 [Methylobacterium haplocladii]|uniref:Glycosyltransferase 2-like domain-containing protein n=2 Tax=Methylobacterium haplocladii TaxID=1176176 RepID=A0A512ILG3_9HYPH|nr:hypothetical protein MHA02_09480 [Methylobacterium haplocladii]GJD85159.1 hypothetical protein HPGCJGGD_3045 [Methylobacterium haplocladii]
MSILEPPDPDPRRHGPAIAAVEPYFHERADRWLGRTTAFTLGPTDDPLFDRRLRPAGHLRDRWIVLTYRMDPSAPPLRPVIRFVRADGNNQDFVLPGVALGTASWLGLLPADLEDIRLAAGPGFVLERVGLRGHASVLVECLGKRPIRVVPALHNRLRGDARRYRDILRGACAVSPLDRYRGWRAERLRPSARTGLGNDLAIRLILPARRSESAAVGRTVESLIAQDHRVWSLTIAWIADDRAGPVEHDHHDPRIADATWDDTTSPAALLAEADALGLLHPGDRLWPEALATLASRLAGSDAVYADEEVAGIPLQPRLKPDWSPDLASVTGYIGRPTLYARALIARFGDRPIGPPDGFALDLAATSAARAVVHIPRILCTTEPTPDDTAARALALDRHLPEVGSPARAEVHGGVLDLHWPVPQPAPLASIVIPSRDRLDLIARVTEGVLRQTAYPAIELVIVDNGSTDPAVLQFYETLRADPRVRIVPYPHPFNFSAMTNAGVREARGQVLVLLNNDIAVLEPGWLSALVAQAVRPEVGAVGAKLLYADGTLQHAGVVVGLGGRAGHLLRRRPGNTPGHLGRLRVAHEVSAVTAACLAVERRKFDAVGGFDETTFAIDFNDVDFCLRLGTAGLKAIWTPQATLSHLESVSRGRPEGDERRRFEREADAFTARWRDIIRHDPFYHPALSLTTFGEDLE